MVLFRRKGVKPEFPVKLTLNWSQARMLAFLNISAILAIPINEIIYYSITLFVSALENFFTQVEQISLEREGEVNCLNYRPPS